MVSWGGCPWAVYKHGPVTQHPFYDTFSTPSQEGRRGDQRNQTKRTSSPSSKHWAQKEAAECHHLDSSWLRSPRVRTEYSLYLIDGEAGGLMCKGQGSIQFLLPQEKGSNWTSLTAAPHERNQDLHHVNRCPAQPNWPCSTRCPSVRLAF